MRLNEIEHFYSAVFKDGEKYLFYLYPRLTMEKKYFSAFSQTTAKITVDFSEKRFYLYTDFVANFLASIWGFYSFIRIDAILL